MRSFTQEQLSLKRRQQRARDKALRAVESLIESEESLRSVRHKLQRDCGIYFLFSGDEIIYIGQSTDIAARLRTHDMLRVPFDSYAFRPCHVDALDLLEAAYIERYKPRLNKDQKPKVRAARRALRLVMGAA